ERLVTCGERPVLAINLYQSKWPMALIQVDTLGSIGDIVAENHGPVSHRFVLKPLKCVDSSLDAPDRTQISCNLILNCRAGARQIAEAYLISFRDQRHMASEHKSPPNM